MSVSSQQRAILQSVKEYSRLLEEISDEDFHRSPAEGTWSYAEVYSHIFKSNLYSLIAAEQCINGTAEKSSASTHWAVRLILLFGRFPPGKYKVPASIEKLTAKISKEEARNLIVKFKTRLADIAPKVNKAKSYHKVKHPRLGLLNAGQWFRFIEIHTPHHQKQLERISKMIRKSRDTVTQGV
jgi:hypothetical protein